MVNAFFNNTYLKVYFTYANTIFIQIDLQIDRLPTLYSLKKHKKNAVAAVRNAAFANSQFYFPTTFYNEDEVINMTRVWDKEKF